MTGKQIEIARKALPLSLNDMSPEQRLLYDELSCRRMINCCLIYGCAAYDFYNTDTQKFGRYAQLFIKPLGEETVIRLYNEQEKDFAEAVVTHGVYTDSEDTTYNSCTWADEQ